MSRNLVRMVVRRGCWVVSAVVVALTAVAPEASAQTMPGAVYHELSAAGHEKLARRIQKKLDMRENPDDDDVADIMDRWEREAGGPATGMDWLTVARLWTRAGVADRAETAWITADEAGDVPAPALLLDRARIAFLAGDDALAEQAYWKGCEAAGDETGLQYWLDIEVLATPDELAEWDRFRRLPASQTDLCGFLHRFWGKRALASTMTFEARMGQHYSRVRYAQRNYRRRSGRKGVTFSNEIGRPRNAAYDDRGLLYIRMGEPDRTTRFAGNPQSTARSAVSAECYQPNESWAYDYPDGTRVYHLTTFGGTDDYWLIRNLGLVYRCGAPEASARQTGNVGTLLTPINQHRFVALGPAANLVLQDLYRSRQGLDPRYAQAAQRMNDPNSGFELNTVGTRALEGQRVLQVERNWTDADAKFAIQTVPEKPDVEPNSRLLVENLQFRGTRRGTSRVWINALIEADRLTPEPETTGFKYRVDARLALVDELGRFSRHQRSFEVWVPRRLGKDESIPVRIPMDVSPGEYQYTLLIRDAFGAPGSSRSGNYFRGEMIVRDLSGFLPTTSDIAVAADSGGSWAPLGPVGPDIGLRPGPAHRTGPDGIAYVYFEAYNLTPGGQYETRFRFSPEDGSGESFDLTFGGEVPFEGAPRTRRILRLELDDTPPGMYSMSVTVTDGETGLSTLPLSTTIVVSRGR